MSIREIQITDKTGSVLKQYKYSNRDKRSTIDVSMLKPDVYYIRVFNGNEWKIKSIIKQ